ncbi:MAG: hypothetical protein ACLFNU_06175, partial [Bacteroidales bacterium]
MIQYNKNKKRRIKVSFWRISLKILFFFIILSPDLAFSQALDVYARVRIRRGSTDGSQIVLYKDGTIVQTTPSGRGGRFEVKLDYGADYILSFEMEDYVTKKININTHVPDDFPKDRNNIIEFEVDLEPQTEEGAIKVYENPVGKIKYYDRVNDFDYDTDYSAKFQKQVRDEEKKIAQEIRQKEIDEEKARVEAEAKKRREEEEARRKAQEEARKAEQEKLRKEAEARALAEAKAKEEAQKRA